MAPQEQERRIEVSYESETTPVHVNIVAGALGRVAGAFRPLSEAERRDAGVVTPTESRAVTTAIQIPDTSLPPTFSTDQIALANRRSEHLPV